MAQSCSLQAASISDYTISASVFCNAGTGHGIVWSYTNASPTIGSNNGSTFGAGGTGTYNTTGTAGCGHAHCYVRGYCVNSGIYVYSSTSDVGATPTCPVVPSVTTNNPTALKPTECTGNGNLTNGGYPSGTLRGFTWATTANPVVPTNSYIECGSGIGAYTGAITGLQENTTYHIRAWGFNASGYGYGVDKVFKTPQIETTAVTNITETSADTGGVVNFSATTAVTDRGICWATTQNPTTGNTVVHLGSGDGTFTYTITGISQNHTYYVRAFAKNSLGIYYGNQQTFAIPITAPRLTGGTDVHLFPAIGWSGVTQHTTWTGATHQRWYNKISTSPTYTLFRTLALPNGNKAQCIGLQPNLNYSFYCTFYDGVTESPASNVITINNTVSPPTATYSSIIII